MAGTNFVAHYVAEVDLKSPLLLPLPPKCLGSQFSVILGFEEYTKHSSTKLHP